MRDPLGRTFGNVNYLSWRTLGLIPMCLAVATACGSRSAWRARECKLEGDFPSIRRVIRVSYPTHELSASNTSSLVLRAFGCEDNAPLEWGRAALIDTNDTLWALGNSPADSTAVWFYSSDQTWKWPQVPAGTYTLMMIWRGHGTMHDTIELRSGYADSVEVVRGRSLIISLES